MNPKRDVQRLRILANVRWLPERRGAMPSVVAMREGCYISLFLRLDGMLLKGQERIVRISAGTPSLAIAL